MTSNHTPNHTSNIVQPQVLFEAGVTIRDEAAKEADAIGLLTQVAFMRETHSSHTEQFIVAALRRAGQLTVSLVAASGPELIGHVAVSPVSLSTGETGWHGLGPLSVHPQWQKQGVGSALVNTALERLRQLHSAGCVLLGDPAYYSRFGFKVWPGLVLSGVPAEYFQALPFGTDVPSVEVSYHAAFVTTS